MIIVWHHRDLRLEDHPALSYATNTGHPVLPLYIHDIESENPWAAGEATKWWLHQSLSDLKKRYQKSGSDLILRKGDSKKILQELIEQNSVLEICWTERFEPALKQRDNLICQWLKNIQIRSSIFQGNYLIDPEEIKTASKTPYLVFTPFSRAVKKNYRLEKLLPSPKLSKNPSVFSEKIEALKLIPKIKWYETIEKLWVPGRTSALKKLRDFCDHHLNQYDQKRNFLAENGVSKLSPHLAFGEISAREIWNRCSDESNSESFLSQILWREFGNYFLHHFPNASNSSWKEKFENYPWEKNKKKFDLWKQSKTGYPVVDAGMRQLWQEGWMHNRARMIVGSFLIKDLMIHWIEGARWFWDTLLDADLANNSLGWQWVAGSGPDASPFFRIFNPILQGKKFDPQGDYVRRYLPELQLLPTKWIHCPWEAPQSVLSDAGVRLGKEYPKPIVEHKQAREHALKAYKKISS